VWHRLLSLAFALALLLQAGVGAAQCLRGLGVDEGLLVEICTAEGKRLALLQPEGDAPAEPGAGVCPVCASLPAVAVPNAPTLSEPVRFAQSVSFPLSGSPHAAPPARAPPYSTRAPPQPA
jgi:hypothetical protein